MRRTLPRIATIALASCTALALASAADIRRPTTEWVSSPSEATRLARVEAGLAPLHLPDEAPVHWSIPSWMELYKIPGLSIAVFDKNELVWAKSYGVKQAGGSEPVMLDTLFQAASISKPVTALAALRYVEQHQWSLDANINEKLLSWKVPENAYTQQQKVTLRQLLSHSAGMTVHGFPGYGVNEPLPTVRQILDGEPPANTEPVRVDFVPETETRYSGGGFTIVQLMMMDQMKKPFPQLMKEAVLAPLGLRHSTFEQPLPPALFPMAAIGTHASGESLEGGWRIHPELATAGLWTTPSDLGRIAIEVSKAWAGKSRRVLSREMAEQMLTMQSEGFGLGFQLEPGNDRFGHGGWNFGFTSSLIAFADSGSGVVMMANSDNGPLLFERIAASLATEYGWTSFTHRLNSPFMTADLIGRLRGAEAVIAWYGEVLNDGSVPGLSPNVLNNVGYGMLLAGNVTGALLVFEANAEFYPDDAYVYDSLGEAYLMAGRIEDAIAAYKKSLELDPNNENARRRLEELGAYP
jgi:CubicO group peptidase (beta-lactamase class C family)